MYILYLWWLTLNDSSVALHSYVSPSIYFIEQRAAAHIHYIYYSSIIPLFNNKCIHTLRSPRSTFVQPLCVYYCRLIDYIWNTAPSPVFVTYATLCFVFLQLNKSSFSTAKSQSKIVYVSDSISRVSYYLRILYTWMLSRYLHYTHFIKKSYISTCYVIINETIKHSNNEF